MSPKGPARARALRVAFVGSSSVEAGSPLPAAFAAELGLRDGEWLAAGQRGAGLAAGRTPPLPPGLPLEAIVVLYTGNDAQPRAELVADVDRVLRSRATVVVWLPPLPYPASSRLAGRDARMREALEAARVVRVPGPVQLEPAHWASDRVHLTRAGYQAYARQVAAPLAQALALRQPAAALATSDETMSAQSPSAQSSGGVLGTLVTPRGARLPLTAVDAVWMARALVGEGGREPDGQAITSTMLRRWALLWDAGQRNFGSLTDLVVGRFQGATPHAGDAGPVALRGYSQPVAVQWRAHRDNRERRRRIRSLEWDAIEPWRRQIVLRIFTGRAPLVAPDAVHFAERGVVQAGQRRNADWQIVGVPGAVNVFVSTANSRRAAEPRVLGADQSAPSNADVAVASVGPRLLERVREVPSTVVIAAAAAMLLTLGASVSMNRRPGLVEVA